MEDKETKDGDGVVLRTQQTLRVKPLSAGAWIGCGTAKISKSVLGEVPGLVETYTTPLGRVPGSSTDKTSLRLIGRLRGRGGFT